MNDGGKSIAKKIADMVNLHFRDHGKMPNRMVVPPSVYHTLLRLYGPTYVVHIWPELGELSLEAGKVDDRLIAKKCMMQMVEGYEYEFYVRWLPIGM